MEDDTKLARLDSLMEEKVPKWGDWVRIYCSLEELCPQRLRAHLDEMSGVEVTVNVFTTEIDFKYKGLPVQHATIRLLRELDLTKRGEVLSAFDHTSTAKRRP